MKRKIVFFDIDGTLFDRQKRLVESAKVAIGKLQEKGHFVAIATGRSPFMFEELRTQLDVKTFVSFNGSYVVHEDKVILKKTLQMAELAQLDHVSQLNEHPLVYLDERGHYTNVLNHSGIESSLRGLRMTYPTYEPEYYTQHDVFQALLYCREEEEQQYIETHDAFDYVRWHELSIDVLPKGSSKAKGIACILDVLGLERKDAIAFGDGLNDIEMLEYVGFGVAMGNGRDEAKLVSDFVTAHAEEDGIMHGLKYLGLI